MIGFILMPLTANLSTYIVYVTEEKILINFTCEFYWFGVKVATESYSNSHLLRLPVSV